MKNILKILFGSLLVIVCLFVLKNSKNYVFEKLTCFSINENQSNVDTWGLCLTQDGQLILYNDENKFITNMIKGEKQKFPHINIVDQLISLVTYMSDINYKKNDNLKLCAFNLFILSRLTDSHIMIPKTFLSLKLDNRINKDVKLVTPNDVRFIKHNNVYAISIGNQLLNIIFELEKSLIELERTNVNTTAYRNFIRTITAQK